MRAGVDINIAGAGGSVTHKLRERAVMVRNSAGAGGSGMKKTVPRRSLLWFTVTGSFRKGGVSKYTQKPINHE